MSTEVDYQGALIVLERGLIAQGEALLRCGLEALFLIKRAVDDYDFALAWAHSDHRDRLRMLEQVGVGEGGLPPVIGDPAELQAKIAEVQQEIQRTKAKRVRVGDIMKKQAAEWLAKLYMIWSFPVHSVPRTVQHNIEAGAPGGGIRGFKSPPSDKGLDFALAWGAIVMVAVWGPLTKLFGVDVAKEVEAFETRFRDLKGAK